MGKDALNAASSFGKGFAPTFNSYMERQQAVEEEQRRFERDQNAKIGFQEMQNAFSSAQADLTRKNDFEISRLNREETTRRIGLTGDQTVRGIQEQGSIQEMLQGKRITSDFSRDSKRHEFDLDKLQTSHQNTLEYARLTQGLKDKSDRRTAFRTFFFTRLLETHKQKFADAQGDKMFLRDMQKISLSSNLDKQAAREALQMKHLLTISPTTAYMMFAAKNNKIPVKLNPATGAPEIDFMQVVNSSDGLKRFENFSKNYTDLQRSGVETILTHIAADTDPTTPEGIERMRQMVAWTGAIADGNTEEVNNLLTTLPNPGGGETPGKKALLGKGSPWNRNVTPLDTPVGVAKGAVALAQNRETERHKMTQNVFDQINTFSSISPRMNSDLALAEAGQITVGDMVETNAEGDPTYDTDGLYSLTSEGEDWLKKADNGKGLVSFDVVRGVPFLMPHSSTVLPERWKDNERLRETVASALDDLSLEDTAEITTLFKGAPTRGRGAGEVGGRTWKLFGDVQHREARARYRGHLSRMGITKSTPRTKATVRAVLVALLDSNVRYRGIFSDYVKEMEQQGVGLRFDPHGERGFPPADASTRPGNATYGFGNQGVR